MTNPYKSLTLLYREGSFRLAYWKLCPHRHDNPLGFVAYPLGAFVHLLK